MMMGSSAYELNLRSVGIAGAKPRTLWQDHRVWKSIKALTASLARTFLCRSAIRPKLSLFQPVPQEQAATIVAL